MNIKKTVSFALIGLLLNISIVYGEKTSSPASGDEKTQISEKISSYLIAPEDVIDILVWKDEELSRTVIVRPDGKITLPLIDDIQAEGKSSLQLKKEITEKLKEFVDDPNITVTVAETNSSKIYILGEIVNPGIYLLRSETSVLQVIAMAGGFREFAASNKMLVLRKNKEKTERIKVSYKDIIKGKSEQNISLQRGDIIIVP